MNDVPGAKFNANAIRRPSTPPSPDDDDIEVPLIDLAWGRSGDKGDKANIGIIARHTDFFPYICKALDEKTVAQRFAHFIDGDADQEKVTRFLLPGSNAINFLIADILGGGGIASLRNDAQGKGFAQILLACPVAVSTKIAEAIK